VALPRTVPRRRALTASGVRVPRGGRNGDQPASYRTEAWQRDALALYDTVGPLHFASHFYSRMLKRLRIYVAKIGNDGKPEEIRSRDDQAVQLLERIQDPGGGRTKLLGNYGRLMFVTGEGYLFGHGEPGLEDWSFVWKEELQFDSSGEVTHRLGRLQEGVQYRQIADANWDELAPGTAVAYRFWTPHPRFSSWADSPMRAVIEDAQELLLLSRSVRATALARQARAPVLLVPQEISPGPVGTLGGEDPKNDPLLDDIAKHQEAALEDPSDPAALAPYILFGANDYLPNIRAVWLHDTDTDYMEKDLRDEVLSRLAVSLDMPPEALKGLSNANHWSAWQITEDMWASHGAPIAEQFCDDLAESYLRPALADADYDGWENLVVTYDASAVVVKPDRFKDSIEARKVGAINFEAVRTAGGWADEDAMSPDEYDEWLLWSTKGAVGGDDEQGNGPPSDAGPPPGQPGPQSEKTNLPSEDSLRILGAAELALLRCRELAGSRLRSRRSSCTDCFEQIEHVAHAQVAATLGQDGLKQLGAPEPIDLVAGGADVLRHLLVNWGYPDAEATRLAGMLEVHAARTLLYRDPPPVPATLANRANGKIT
jgi:hypothetical protein